VELHACGSTVQPGYRPLPNRPLRDGGGWYLYRLEMNSGDRQMQFEALLTAELYQAAWAYSCRLCANPQSAEDLLQEALIVAFTRFHQLRDRQTFKGWLFSIIRTKYIDQRRRHISRPATLELPVLSATEKRNRDAEVVNSALSQLPENQSELLCLYYYEELSVKEVAIVLGTSENTVKQRLLRARAALRRLLTPMIDATDTSALF
ncbi:RNA polymerase sigma factor, partial [bacterium]|nr:RNA polymerase sigma factor [bacterium]